MAKSLLHYNGLFGDGDNPFGSLPVHHEPISYRTEIYSYEIHEHLHSDLVQIFIFKSGGGLIISSDKKFAIEVPCAWIIPANTLHGFVLLEDIMGEVFTISDVLFEQFINNDPTIFSAFESFNHIPFLPESQNFKNLVSIIDLLIHDINYPVKSSQRSVSLLFRVLLLNLNRQKQEEKPEESTSDDKSIIHFLAFKKLMKKHIHERKTVHFFAQELNLTAVHLNRICKFVTQKSTLTIIHEQLLEEAKRYLKGTTNTIAETAYYLDFKDTAQFSKFFKKNTGISPKKFIKER